LTKSLYNLAVFRIFTQKALFIANELNWTELAMKDWLLEPIWRRHIG